MGFSLFAMSFLVGFDEVDSSLMPSFVMGGIEEDVDAMEDFLKRHIGAAEGDHVGVVVGDHEMADVVVVGKAADDALDFVGADADAFPARTDENAGLGLSFRDGRGGLEGLLGIVAALFGEGAAVDDFEAQSLEMGDDVFLEGIAAVVAAEADSLNVFHDRSP